MVTGRCRRSGFEPRERWHRSHRSGIDRWSRCPSGTLPTREHFAYASLEREIQIVLRAFKRKVMTLHFYFRLNTTL